MSFIVVVPVVNNDVDVIEIVVVENVLVVVANDVVKDKDVGDNVFVVVVVAATCLQKKREKIKSLDVSNKNIIIFTKRFNKLQLHRL